MTAEASKQDPNDSTVDDRSRLKALEESGDVDALLAELENPKQHTFKAVGQTFAFSMRGSAARSLGRLGDRRALEPLQGLLADPYFTVRAEAVEALGDLGDRAAVPALIERLDDEDLNVRHFAARALGKLGDPAAVPALIKQLSNENPRLRMAVAEALAEIGDPAAVEPLQGAVKRERVWNWRRRLRLREALRAVRSRGS